MKNSTKHTIEEVVSQVEQQMNDIVDISDTFSVVVIRELSSLLMERDHLPWGKAVEVASCINIDVTENIESDEELELAKRFARVCYESISLFSKAFFSEGDYNLDVMKRHASKCYLKT